MGARHLPPLRRAALVAAVVVAAGSCTSSGGELDDARSAGAVVPASTSTTWATTTTEAPTTTTTTEPVDGLAPGMKGPEVEALQTRLVELGYDVGPVDGKYGYLTSQAVLAFQKVEGMDRTGRATTAVLDHLAGAATPAPHVADGEATRVEVHLPTQTMQVWKDGALHAIFNISSGNGKKFRENGYSGVAVTPTGRYTINRRISGWRHGPLGGLYNPLYFNGGIALHGSYSVPAYPASHGCVRVNMAAAEWLPDLLPNGTPVYVVGDHPVVAPVPPPPAPKPDPTTTTTDPPTTTTEPPTTSTTTTSTTEASTTTTAPV